MHQLIPRGRTGRLGALLGAILFGATACTSFSAARPADVPLGSSYHSKVGLGAPFDPAVSWFWSLDDCVLCRTSQVPVTELGYSVGWRGAAGRKYAVGLFLDGLAPQGDLYVQLRESADVNAGVGARAGPAAPGRFWTAKLYALYDRRRGDRSRLLLNPGLYFYGNTRDPDGDHGLSQAWLLGVTQTVGFEYDVGSVTYTPQLTIVGAHGELGGDAAALGAGRSRLRFDDVFATAALGITFRRRP